MGLRVTGKRELEPSGAIHTGGLREVPQVVAELGRRESPWPLWSELGLKGWSAE